MSNADRAYQAGINDLIWILNVVSGRRFIFWGKPRPRGRVLIRDINPPEFWRLPEVEAIVRWSQIPAKNIIFIPSDVDDLLGDHPIVRLVDSGLAVIRRPICTFSPIGFRIADAGNRSAVTLMTPNDSDPSHPLISSITDRMMIGAVMSQVDSALAMGEMIFK